MTLVASSHNNGTDLLKKSKREYIDGQEGFRVDLHLQEVFVTEYNSAMIPHNSTT
jgi:hypothetical protein